MQIYIIFIQNKNSTKRYITMCVLRIPHNVRKQTFLVNSDLIDSLLTLRHVILFVKFQID